DTEARTLGDVIEGADIFLGLSAPGVLTPEFAKRMASQPLILALANPDPEINPDDAKRARPDAIVATGRSDYPNQVNNVLCFPFIFRGALDVGATEINEAMKLACVTALADLAMAETSELVSQAYGGQPAPFGPENLIPKPFGPRLLTKLAPAVAKAAMESGVARRPIEDFDAYYQKLTAFVFRSGLLMKPIFDAARRKQARLVYAEGEERRVLQAAQQIIDEKLAEPILIGRRKVIETRSRQLGLRMRPDTDFELVNIHKDKRFRDYWSEYHTLAGRRGTSPEEAKTVIRTQHTAVAALMVQRGGADAMLCGTVGRFHQHLKHVDDIIGKADGTRSYSTLTGLILPSGTFFICDTHVTPDPSAEEIAEMTRLAAEEVRCFGIVPKVALLSRSNFGTSDTPSALKMREALRILSDVAPELEVDGEMHADAALSESIRKAVLPDSRLSGQANLLIMPNVDAANIAYNLLKMLGGGVTLGPILVGAAQSVHVLTQSVTVRGLVNMSALAVARAHATNRE
ncbi:MAG: NADP-dependent malic enzyme, partial [Lysobacterales bacterium]